MSLISNLLLSRKLPQTQSQILIKKRNPRTNNIIEVLFALTKSTHKRNLVQDQTEVTAKINKTLKGKRVRGKAFENTYNSLTAMKKKYT